MSKLLIALITIIGISHSVNANLLSTYFKDGMVLEGYPRASSLFGQTRHPHMTVTLDFDNVHTYTTTSDSTGRWRIQLPPTPSSLRDRHTITVRSPSDPSATLRDVLFGTTLYCGGLSSTPSTEISSLPRTQEITLARATSTGVLWNAASTYSTACLRQAKELSEASNTPIGLIDATGLGLSALKGIEGATIQHFAWVKGNANLFTSEKESEFRLAARAAVVRNEYIVGNGTLPRIIAHRGSAATCPENTLPSQEVARRGGVTWIEDDTSPSLDKVPIVMHDDKVDRTTDGTGAVRSLTLAQIKALDAGSWFAPSFAGTRVPTLQEQLADLRQRGGNLLLEIKGEHSVEELTTIYNIIKEENMTERVIIQSFTVVSLERMYQVAPELPLGLLTSSIDSDLEEVCTRLHLTHYNPNWASVNKKPETVETLHKLGVAIYVWTPDTPSVWQKLADMGVDGIITNKSVELVGYQEGVSAGNMVKDDLFGRAPAAANHDVKFFSI